MGDGDGGHGAGGVELLGTRWVTAPERSLLVFSTIWPVRLAIRSVMIYRAFKVHGLVLCPFLHDVVRAACHAAEC